MLSRREFGQLALVSLPLGLPLDTINSKIHGVRLGIQSYSFRDKPLDDAIKAIAEVGIGECELFSYHIEPPPTFLRPRPGGGNPFQDPAVREQIKKWQAEVKEWRLNTPLDYFAKIRAKFDAAGILLQSYNLSFNDSFSDEEIDRGFVMAKALGVKFITSSSTLTSAKRVAPFADKHKMRVGMHNHDDTKDPNQFAKPESFEEALSYSKYFAINLDIGHFVAAGYDPVTFIQEHHKQITNLHLKDRKKDHGKNTPWGEGDTPIKEVLTLMKQKRYPIPINIEYEYQGADSIAEVKKCFQYAKDALG